VSDAATGAVLTAVAGVIVFGLPDTYSAFHAHCSLSILLWLEAGRPDGRAEDFWADAVKQDELGEPPATDIAAVLTVISIAVCAPHLPDRQPIALTQTKCFANAMRQAQMSGGRAQFGWMFQYKLIMAFQGQGYLIAINHAVWREPSGYLIDVTPFHQNSINHPLTQDNAVIFLVDDRAEPDLVPLPSKFYALSDDEQSVEYVKQLAQREEEQFRLAYDAAKRQVGAGSRRRGRPQAGSRTGIYCALH
jgi:Protein of unknown function (DUF2934)